MISDPTIRIKVNFNVELLQWTQLYYTYVQAVRKMFQELKQALFPKQIYTYLANVSNFQKETLL